jgi:hypothetical protein
LPTDRSGNDRGKADDERVAWAALNGGGDGIQGRSCSKDSSSSGGVGGGSSSKRRIDAGGLDKVVQRRGWLGGGGSVLGQIRMG